jgi:hypothetical protein
MPFQDILIFYSLRAIQVIAGVLGRAGEEGQKKRLEAAKTGEVTWFPPPGLGRPMSEADRRKKNDAVKEGKKARKFEAEEVIPLGLEGKPRHGRRDLDAEEFDL